LKKFAVVLKLGLFMILLKLWGIVLQRIGYGKLKFIDEVVEEH